MDPLKSNLSFYYDDRHGGPWDRGAADSYYGRIHYPHYYRGDTGFSEVIKEENMTAEEIQAYNAGYDYNEQYGEKKEY